MRLLLVEDQDLSERAALQSIGRAIPSADVTVARSRDEALGVIANFEFDLILCDIRLPPQGGSADVQESHGLAVHAECQATCPNTPLIFLTGFATSRETSDQLARGGVATVYGIANSPLVSLVPKDDPEHLEQKLEELYAGFMRVQALDVVRTDWPSDMFRRAVGLYAIEMGHRRAEVRMSPGLSGAQVGLARLTGEGETPAAVFLKVCPHDVAADEYRRYGQYVSNRLAPGLFAPTQMPTYGGLAGSATLVSTVADRCESLFDLALHDSDRAVDVVEHLKTGMRPWTEAARRTVPSTLGDLRRARLSDARLAEFPAASDLARRADAFGVDVRELICHGDLHGENVLVPVDGGRPVLIDFGDTGPGLASTDPVTLELSILFHRAGPARDARHGTGLNWGEWADLDRFASGAPMEEFIRAVRSWALEIATEEEVLAFAYAHSLRQLKYSDVNRDLAMQIAESAIVALGI